MKVEPGSCLSLLINCFNVEPEERRSWERRKHQRNWPRSSKVVWRTKTKERRCQVLFGEDVLWRGNFLNHPGTNVSSLRHQRESSLFSTSNIKTFT